MSTIEQLRHLPVSERIQIVEDLWDSIAEESDSIRISPAQIEELDRRLDRLEAAPEEGSEWSVLKSRILQNL